MAYMRRFPTTILHTAFCFSATRRVKSIKIETNCSFFASQKEKRYIFPQKKYTILLFGCEVFFTFVLIKPQMIDKMTTQRYFYSYFFYFTYRVKREVLR